MSYSTVNPTPPNTCCAIAVMSRNVCAANNFAIGASRATDRPSVCAHAASHTNVSAPSSAVTASAK